MPGAGVTIQDSSWQRGVNEPRVKDCRSHFIHKKHGALPNTAASAPPGGGSCERCPACHTLLRLGGCACTACSAPRDRGGVREPRGCRARSWLCSCSPCHEGCMFLGKERALELPAGGTGLAPPGSRAGQVALQDGKAVRE